MAKVQGPHLIPPVSSLLLCSFQKYKASYQYPRLETGQGWTLELVNLEGAPQSLLSFPGPPALPWPPWNSLKGSTFKKMRIQGGKGGRRKEALSFDFLFFYGNFLFVSRSGKAPMEGQGDPGAREEARLPHPPQTLWKPLPKPSPKAPGQESFLTGRFVQFNK